MSKFKSGDMVRNFRGEVLRVGRLSVDGSRFTSRTSPIWHCVENWELAPDYTKMVEAASEAIEYFRAMNSSHFAEARRLKKALAALEPEPEYKWLAMDDDRHKQKHAAYVRPTRFKGGGWWRYAYSDWDDNCADFPPFLKPGQLWERLFHPSDTWADGTERYDDSWWRLVEDHSKSCENCKHYAYFINHTKGMQADICWEARSTEAKHGMEGCEWQAK